MGKQVEHHHLQSPFSIAREGSFDSDDVTLSSFGDDDEGNDYRRHESHVIINNIILAGARAPKSLLVTFQVL